MTSATTRTHGITNSVPVRFVYEALIKPFPGDPAATADTGRLQLDVAALAVPGTGTFTRTDGGDFAANGFAQGMEIHTFGFANAANNGRFQIVTLSPTVLTVARLTDGLPPAPLIGETGSGDEAAVNQGSRGVILDRFFDMRRVVAAQEQAALAAYQLAFPAAPPPGNDLEGLLIALGGAVPTPQQAAELLYAYLNDWREELDDGIRNWASVGLAITDGIFAFQSRRDLQNDEGGNVGIDADARRGDVEADISLVDTLLALLDDPNLDEDFSDSFVTNHLLPMFGVPQFVADFRTPLNGFAEFIDDNIVGPVRMALNPITSLIDELKEIPKELVKDYISETYGIDVDQFDLLLRLSNKMDMAFVEINGTRVPVFKPGDHEKIDAYMGINGIAFSETLQESLQDIPGITFYDDPTVALGGNVEFDKTKFAGYANSVQLGKLLLLVEDPIDGETVGAGQLSALMSDLTGAPYEWSLLNMNGNHGGNIFTTTLQRPGQMIEVVSDDGAVENRRSDERPWLKLIDGGSWRDDIITTTTLLFRVTPSQSQGAAAASAVWSADVTAGQDYHVQVSWLANVTQKLVDPLNPAGNRVGLDPASNVTYRVFDGAASVTPIAEIHNVNQRDFNRDYVDGDVTFDYLRDLDTGLVAIAADATNRRFVSDDVDFVAAGFQVGDVIHASGFRKNAGAYTIAAVQAGFIEVAEALAAGDEDANGNESLVKRLVVQAITGVLRVELANDANGHVIAGPVRIENVADGTAQRVQLARDPQTLDPLEDSGGPDDGFEETGTSWVDLSFPAGSGNFPLWESELLRPAYRALFTDWQNGTLQWPDLGDETSPDPNQFAPGHVSARRDHPRPRDAVRCAHGSVTASRRGHHGQRRGPSRVRRRRRHQQHHRRRRRAAPIRSASSPPARCASPATSTGCGTRKPADRGRAHRHRPGRPGCRLRRRVPARDRHRELGIRHRRLDAPARGFGRVDRRRRRGRHRRPGHHAARPTPRRSSRPCSPRRSIPRIPTASTLQINEDELVEIAQLAAAVIAESRSAINVRAGARLNASRDVLLDADALADVNVSVQSPEPYLGVTYGSSSPTAEIVVEEGVVISAVEDVEVSAAAGNTLSSDRPSYPMPARSFTFRSPTGRRARRRSWTSRPVRASPRRTLRSARTTPTATRTRPVAEGFTASSGPGLGATFVLGSYHSSATAEVAAAVNVSGDLTIAAESIDIQNENRAFGQISDSAHDDAVPRGAGGLPVQDRHRRADRERYGDRRHRDHPQRHGRRGGRADRDREQGGGTAERRCVRHRRRHPHHRFLRRGALPGLGGRQRRRHATASASAARWRSRSSATRRRPSSVRTPSSTPSPTSSSNPTRSSTNPIPVFDPSITLDPVSGATGTDRIGDEYDRAAGGVERLRRRVRRSRCIPRAVPGRRDRPRLSFVHAGGVLPAGRGRDRRRREHPRRLQPGDLRHRRGREGQPARAARFRGPGRRDPLARHGPARGARRAR